MRNALALSAFALILSGCAADARLLAENADLKLKLHFEEEQLRQQQDYVAATQDRDSQIQTDMQQIFGQINNDMWEWQEQVRQEIRREEKNKCGI